MALEVTGHLNLEAMRKNKPWLPVDDERLIQWVNANKYPSGRAIWGVMAELGGHTSESCKSHWNHVLKKRCTYDGHKWVLKQPNLFEGIKPQPKKEVARKTPQNAPTGVSPKRVVVKKSFLWGAFTFERYE